MKNESTLIAVTRWSHPDWEHDLWIRQDGDPQEGGEDRPELYLLPGQQAGLLAFEEVQQMTEAEFYAMPRREPAGEKSDFLKG